MNENSPKYYEICVVAKNEANKWVHISNDYTDIGPSDEQYYAIIVKESMLDYYSDEDAFFSQLELIDAVCIEDLHDSKTTHQYTVLVFDSAYDLDYATSELDKYIKEKS